MKRLRYIMLLAGLMSLSLQTIYAQRITRSFRNTSMSEALTILAKSTKDYHSNFMYDELEDFTVTTSIVKRTAPDAIRQIMGFYPMKMTIDGENIFVECTQKTPTKMIGRIIDNKKRPVDFANVALLNVRDSSLINGGVTNENGQFVIPCEATKAIRGPRNSSRFPKAYCVTAPNLSRLQFLGFSRMYLRNASSCSSLVTILSQ